MSTPKKAMDQSARLAKLEARQVQLSRSAASARTAEQLAKSLKVQVDRVNSRSETKFSTEALNYFEVMSNPDGPEGTPGDLGSSGDVTRMRIAIPPDGSAVAHSLTQPALVNYTHTVVPGNTLLIFANPKQIGDEWNGLSFTESTHDNPVFIGGPTNVTNVLCNRRRMPASTFAKYYVQSCMLQATYDIGDDQPHPLITMGLSPLGDVMPPTTTETRAQFMDTACAPLVHTSRNPPPADEQGGKIRGFTLPRVGGPQYYPVTTEFSDVTTTAARETFLPVMTVRNNGSANVEVTFNLHNTYFVVPTSANKHLVNYNVGGDPTSVMHGYDPLWGSAAEVVLNFVHFTGPYSFISRIGKKLWSGAKSVASTLGSAAFGAAKAAIPGLVATLL